MTMRFLFLLFALLLSLAHAEEFLDPAVAFKPTARALDGQTIEVGFAIAKGYYLYRDKFRFAVEGDAVTLGEPVIAKGKEKDDETFGKVEVFYQSVAIRLPVERNVSGPLSLKLNITSGLRRRRRLLSAADADGRRAVARSGNGARRRRGCRGRRR